MEKSIITCPVARAASIRRSLAPARPRSVLRSCAQLGVSIVLLVNFDRLNHLVRGQSCDLSGWSQLWALFLGRSERAGTNTVEVFGGRWNKPGRPVYSTSQGLCIMPVFHIFF